MSVLRPNLPNPLRQVEPITILLTNMTTTKQVDSSLLFSPETIWVQLVQSKLRDVGEWPRWPWLLMIKVKTLIRISWGLVLKPSHSVSASSARISSRHDLSLSIWARLLPVFLGLRGASVSPCVCTYPPVLNPLMQFSNATYSFHVSLEGLYVWNCKGLPRPGDTAQRRRGHAEAPDVGGRARLIARHCSVGVCAPLAN